MKVTIDEDEWFPVFSMEIAKDYQIKTGAATEVSEEFYEDYLRVMKQFDEMQSKLRELYSG